MHFRAALGVPLAALVFAFGGGCQKTGSPAPVLPPTLLPANTIARVHWLGQRRLELEAGAFFFCRVWSLPETAQLQAQTFDRLAANSWRGLVAPALAAQIPAAVLRPLFDDLAREETYLEIRAAPGAPPAGVFAIHLHDPSRAGLWGTNLAIAAELFTGALAVKNPGRPGWVLAQTNPARRLALSRVGDWTVVSAGPLQNPLSDEIAFRIRRDGVPFVSAGTNLWLEADLDLPRLAAVSSLSARTAGGEGRGEVGLSAISHLLSPISHLRLAVTGDGGNVIARGELAVAQPLSAPAKSWQLPTDLMTGPLLGFTAVRGVQGWLNDWKPWSELSAGAAPDQIYFWSTAGSPFQTYLAAPLPAAGTQVSALTGHLLQHGNPWLAAHGYIGFDRAADGNGLTWGNFPDLRPFLKSAGAGADGWLYAGLLPEPQPGTNSVPAVVDPEVLRDPGLVYYDWEMTGRQIQPRLALSQTARQLARGRQLPLTAASLNWLGTLIPRLGASTTIIEVTAPHQINFYRRSTVGFTALELHLLADWLESPQFPFGLYSTAAPAAK